MGHFSAAQWFEFARDTAPSEVKALMQRHLENGCDGCQKVSRMWSEVLEISHRELNYNPPPSAIRAAEAAFVPREGWDWLPQIAELARLIFDSINNPHPAAVRGGMTSSRQFLQEAKPFMIDLRVECEPARKRVRLIGQVLNSTEPNKHVANVEVFLLNGEHLAARTKANPSGEFDLEFEEKEGLQLFIDIRGQKVIEIRLPVSSGEFAWKSTV